MEGLTLLKELPQKREILCKLDVRGAYFPLALRKIFQKFVRFPWRVNLH